MSTLFLSVFLILAAVPLLGPAAGTIFYYNYQRKKSDETSKHLPRLPDTKLKYETTLLVTGLFLALITLLVFSLQYLSQITRGSESAIASLNPCPNFAEPGHPLFRDGSIGNFICREGSFAGILLSHWLLLLLTIVTSYLFWWRSSKIFLFSAFIPPSIALAVTLGRFAV